MKKIKYKRPKFKIGDRVLVTGIVSGVQFSKVKGIVKTREGFFSWGKKDYWYGINFGKGFSGHDLTFAIRTNTGWYCPENTMEKLIPKNKGRKK